MAKLIDLIVSGKSSFANDVNAKDIYADKFIKTGSSSSYVLLGDGSHKKWTTASEANTIVARDANGYILATYYNSNISNEDTITIGSVYVRNTTDNWIRRMSFTKFVENLYTNGLDGRYVNVSGDTMTGLLTVKTGSSNNGIKAGNTYINSIEGSLIFQNNTALRFGGADWDWNVWAGLKYVHSSKTIYLGLADNNAFTANSAQSGGKIYFPGIDNLYIGHGTYKLWHEGNDGSGSGLDADLLDGQHSNRFAWIYNSNNHLCSTSVSCNDIAADSNSNAHMGMIYASTNNPTGTTKWVHVWSQTWNRGVISSWVSQIALGVQDGTGMWYRATAGALSSKGWTRVLDDSNYTSYVYSKTQADDRFVNVTGDTMTGTLAMSTGAAIHLWDDSATTSHRLTLRNQSDIGRIYNYTGSAYGAMYIGHDGESAIVITSGQNVGVGTGSPSEKLSVNGWVGTIGNTGWYSITHAGGVHMTDSTWVRIYNNKKFYVNNSEYNAIHSAGGVYVAGCVHSYSNLLKTTYNGNTITIGSQNSSWGHIENSANINFYFNRSVHVDGALWRYNTNYGIDSDGKFYAHTVYANRSGSGTAGGVSLYSNSDPMTYGIASRNTADYGTHGSVTGDWATYLTMSNTSNRGWIFRTSDGTRRGSISALGHLNMDGNGYYGGNLSAANTGATSPDNAALEVREYSRADTATGTAPHTIMYAPRIGFHWGSRYWGNIAFFDSAFRFISYNGASYVNIYCANMYGTASNVTVTNSDDNNTYRMVWHSGTGLYSTGGIYCNPNSDYLYATSMVTSSWFRSTGNTGWYSSSYGGGWYMTDTSWIRSYGGHGVVAGGFYHSSYGSANYLLTSNGGAWAVHTGRNNEANKIVRTDGSGYLQTGYINTNVSTEDTLSCSRLFFEYNNDGYIRKMSVDRFKSLLMDPTYLQRLRRANLNITTSDTGMVPPDILGLRNGYPLHTDPEFASGTNSISVYNNSGGSAVTVTRESSSTSGNSSGYCLHIHSAASGASPNGGGFYFATPGVKARTYICIFRASIPTGYSVVFHTNSVGSGGNYGWLTSTDGTGKYEWYAHMVQFGTSPSSTFFFTLDRAAAVDWYLSYANVINVSNTSYDGLRTRYADYATDSNMVDGQHFSYSNSSNSPTYLWGTNSNGSSFLAARGSISVNYANYAGYTTKLRRRDDSSDYSLQHHWTGTYWYLRGYSGDTYHAGVQVEYANNAGNADTVDGLHAHTQALNNQANKLVRTEGNGYIQTSYIYYGGNEKNNSNPSYVAGFNGSDNYIRSYNTAYLRVSNADMVDDIHADRFAFIYNSANYNASSSLTLNDMAANTNSNAHMGMIYAGTDNPVSSSGNWLHVWSQTWSRGVTSSWCSQIAVGVQAGTGMWYRTTSGALAGRGWNRVLDSANYTSYVNNYYWANVKISTSSNSATYPTFANMKSTGRVYLDEWIQFSGGSGLYWPNANGAHLYANTTTSYAGLMTQGARNGYCGLHCGPNTNYMTVMSTDVHHGLYCESTGIWEIYYNRSSGGVGIRTSSITKNFNVSGQSYLSSNTWIGTTSGSEMLNVGGWVGTTGDTGWYNISYGGGIYMTDTTWVRTYNSKKFYVSNTNDDAIYTAGGFKTARTSGTALSISDWGAIGCGSSIPTKFSDFSLTLSSNAVWMATTGGGSEAAGIGVDGDAITMWSPQDSAIKHYDTDTTGTYNILAQLPSNYQFGSYSCPVFSSSYGVASATAMKFAVFSVTCFSSSNYQVYKYMGANVPAVSSVTYISTGKLRVTTTMYYTRCMIWGIGNYRGSSASNTAHDSIYITINFMGGTYWYITLSDDDSGNPGRGYIYVVDFHD